MIKFALFVVRLRENSRRPPAGRYLLETGVGTVARKYNHIIPGPHGTSRRTAVNRGECHRGSTGNRHSLQRREIVEKTHPLSIGRDERSAGSAFVDRSRLEPIKRTNEELRPVVARVDNT